MSNHEQTLPWNDLGDLGNGNDSETPSPRPDEQPRRDVGILAVQQLLDDTARVAFDGEAVAMREPVLRNRTTALEPRYRHDHPLVGPRSR